MQKPSVTHKLNQFETDSRSNSKVHCQNVIAPCACYSKYQKYIDLEIWVQKIIYVPLTHQNDELKK